MNNRVAIFIEKDSGFVVPHLTTEWKNTTRIVGTGEFISDFCMIKDAKGRWHSIGIVMDELGRTDKMFHAIGEKLMAPYCHQKRIVSGKPDAEHMWAPFAIYKGSDTAWLYYAHFNKNKESSIRILESKGETLDEWFPLKHHELEDGNIVFREPDARDPVIFWEEKLSNYLMYYAAESVIRCRTSKDLIHWSESVTVMGVPEGYTEAESPFVFRKNGYYYLFVSGFDYGRVSVYISVDPFNFGDAINDRIAEISGHAPEIVTMDGVDYIICAAISSTVGNNPGEHDLMGAYIQPIRWVRPDKDDYISSLNVK